MTRFSKGHVSPALVISVAALVFAIGGTSLASVPVAFVAKTLGLNSKQKKQVKSIADQEIKSKASKLSVLSAKTATNATNSINAINAINATNATNATNAGHAGTADSASNVNGLIRWRTTIATAGASATSPNTVVLATAGPFTVTGHCYEETTFTYAATYIRTSQDGSYEQGYDTSPYAPLNASNGDVQASEETAKGATATHVANFYSPNDGSWAAESPDGSLTLDGFGNQGVWLQGASGPACSFSGYMVVE